VNLTLWTFLYKLTIELKFFIRKSVEFILRPITETFVLLSGVYALVYTLKTFHSFHISASCCCLPPTKAEGATSILKVILTLVYLISGRVITQQLKICNVICQRRTATEATLKHTARNVKILYELAAPFCVTSFAGWCGGPVIAVPGEYDHDILTVCLGRERV
jgi:hypothetical protein